MNTYIVFKLIDLLKSRKVIETLKIHTNPAK